MRKFRRSTDPCMLVRIFSCDAMWCRYAADLQEAREIARDWQEQQPHLGPFQIVAASGKVLVRFPRHRQRP